MEIKNKSIFVNKRVANTNDSTLGVLYLDNKLMGYVIEDQPQEVKVKSETRIPAGIYKLGLRRQETPLTLRYRKKYSWFKYHIQLLNVKGFTDIYIHIGNTDDHTAGCQLLNSKAIVKDGEFAGEQSTKIFKEFYEAVFPALESGKEVYYKIIDN